MCTLHKTFSGSRPFCFTENAFFLYLTCLIYCIFTLLVKYVAIEGSCVICTKPSKTPVTGLCVSEYKIESEKFMKCHWM